MFRLIALLLPVLALVVVELGLRLAGCGYPTPFFLKTHQGGDATRGPNSRREVWIENQKFGWRFFPPAIARTPEPAVIPVEKPTNAVRIVVLGESAAMGDPEPDFGVARVLEALLRARYPGVEFEVVNAAMTAINSHVVREIAKDCRPLRADVWIVYLGNNEVVGPFGAGTVFTSQVPGRPVIRASIALKATRLGQWLAGLGRRERAPAEWEGMEMFLRQQVRADDTKLQTAYGYFRRNLDDILRLGAQSGAQVVVSTMVGNVKDCPPFASLNKPELSTADQARWKEHQARGSQLLAERKFTEALQSFRAAAALDDHHAELSFRLGQCLLALGQTNEARPALLRARDLDTLRFRPDTRINQVIRDSAAARPGVRLVDAERVFERQSPGGLPGEEFLFEHVHFNFDGNYVLARALADEVAAALPDWVKRTAANSAPWLTKDECAQWLAFTDWNRLEIAEEVRRRLQQPPFTNQWGTKERDQRWRGAIERLKQSVTPDGLKQASELARAAVKSHPADWRLRRNLAKLLEAAGDNASAATEWREVLRLVPHEAEAFFHLGNLAQAATGVDVEDYFREALKRKPDAVEVLNGLGLLLSARGRHAEAIGQFEKALSIKPRFVEARVNLGQVLAGLGRVEDARVQYESALRQDTNCVAAHINLGKLLSGLGRKEEAAQHYREALRLKPDQAVAHFNLGNALAALGHGPEATEHYAAAVRLRPDFVEARCNLGQELARSGRSREAREQFAEAVKLQPDFAEARFNLGVALAQERRFEEAVVQFREVLRLEPAHAKAQQYLEQAERLRGPR